MEEILSLLQEKIPEAELIDAQSFLWLMWMINDNTPEFTIDDVEDNETVVTTGYKEGRVTQYYVKKYERDPRNRTTAVKLHGYWCMACGFDFEKTYGSLGKEFIEVHHIVPLANRNEEVIVNPKTDLVCLCANCHCMIHHKKNAMRM